MRENVLDNDQNNKLICNKCFRLNSKLYITVQKPFTDLSQYSNREGGGRLQILITIYIFSLNQKLANSQWQIVALVTDPRYEISLLLLK